MPRKAMRWSEHAEVWFLTSWAVVFLTWAGTSICLVWFLTSARWMLTSAWAVVFLAWAGTSVWLLFRGPR